MIVKLGTDESRKFTVYWHRRGGWRRDPGQARATFRPDPMFSFKCYPGHGYLRWCLTIWKLDVRLYEKTS